MSTTRNAFILIALLVTLGNADAQEKITKNGYMFTMADPIACVKVQDQANTGTCWSYSTASLLESEAHLNGKDLSNLSEMFFVRFNYLEKAEQYLRYHGKTNFSQGSLAHDVLRIYSRYGAMPEKAYDGLVEGKKRHNHSLLEKELKDFLDAIIAEGTVPMNWKSDFNALLDSHLGELPSKFEYRNSTMTPREFADKYVDIDPSAYITFTSFQHHPYFEECVLEIPDNYIRASYLNLPLDDLLKICHYALDKGHSIVWDCDVSERGFSARQGLAIVPTEVAFAQGKQAPFDNPGEEVEIDADLRQREFDMYSLTDDHLMHIVGSARDQNGKRYFYVKNSWGDDSGLDGFLFASENYFLLNTIAITLHKNAVPPDLYKKINAATAEGD